METGSVIFKNLVLKKTFNKFKLKQVSELPERLIKIGWASLLEFLIQQVWGRG